MQYSIPQKKYKLTGIITWVLLLLTPFAASARTVVGGTFDANLSIPSYVGFFGNTTEFNNLPDGLSFIRYTGPLTSGSTETASFDINNGDPIINPDPTSGGHPGIRNRAPSDFAYNNTASTLSDLAAGSGIIGLTGIAVWNTSSLFGDLTLDVADLDTGTGTWTVFNQIDIPDSPVWVLSISSTIIDANGFTLTGDILATSFGSAFMGGVAADSVVGDFTLTASTIPVPAAVWFFGSGLFGLLALGRKKKCEF